MAPNTIEYRKSWIYWGIQTCLIALILLVAPITVQAKSASVVQESLDWKENFRAKALLPDYQNFIESIQNGEKGMLRGVYVPGILALPIVQQPVGYPGYVSQNNDEITQFRMANEVGNVGLLAHNFLSGALFSNLAEGQEVRLIYGDGTVEYFVIDQILQYQALQPYSPTSEFRDLENNATMTAEQLFAKVYRGERHVTFQTCIEANGNGSWGRLFIIAHPKLFPYIEQQFIQDNVFPYFYY